MPAVHKMKLSKLYKSELVEVCKSLNINAQGKKDDLKARVKQFMANQPSAVVISFIANVYQNATHVPSVQTC